MNLSLKATRFILEALEHYVNSKDQRLENTELSEDEISDLINDRQYLMAIRQDFHEYRDEPMRQQKAVQTGADH